ncbi:hypothetical protein JIN85_17230 [Luteolibacter pohnpeiensis]|uniref:Glycosyl hydrolase family 13 catalytic domain-containing protein n=1 Tax=Luteolibacter pohnpeiensis TaxID=454153 RepID=A0A934VSC9_9BACT|nr:alpha-amylase family glycosyl hydrolase [Luteolibacter pohnpeiensis]MBK1884166.1 hypothetical protein [Luteolibacter pohnpeiensis]
MSTIPFELFAPYNNEAFLVADFNHWEPIAMTKGEDGYFRIEVDLDDGRYLYRFEITSKSWFYEPDQRVQIADPYATEIDDTEDQNAILEIKNGKRVIGPYEWKNDMTPLPQDHELIIYELLVHDFLGHNPGDLTRGKFTDIIPKLDYLTDLGVNAIELLPVEEYPGENGWGYNPRHFFAVESSYGTPTEYKQMIDACHGHGMRVFKDGVYNHAETSTPLAQIDHDYWFHHDPVDAENNWGPEFNYVKYDENLDLMPARKFIGDVIGHWVHEYHIDGIRFDAVAQLNNFDALRYFCEKGKEISGEKPFTLIAEYIPDDPEVVLPDGPTDACWNESFYFAIKDIVTGAEIDIDTLCDCIDPRRRGYESGVRIVNYLCTHDHNQIMADIGHAGIQGEAAFKRAAMGAVILLTAIGIPMIWAGQEFGHYKDKSTEPAPIDWGLLDGEDNQQLLQLYKALIYLRKTNSALHGNDIDFFHIDPGLPLIAYNRWNGEGARVVTVLNLSDQYLGGYQIPGMPVDGTWKDWTHDCEVQVSDGTLQIDLGEWEAKVFVI